MPQLKTQSQTSLSTIQRYGLAILSVSVALGGALLVERLHLRNVSLFLFAIAVASWYGGAGGAGLAFLLSCLSLNYFFTLPYYELKLSRSDLAYYIVFAAFASLVTWFSAVRAQIEEDLRRARDKLQIEVAERTQQASLLNLTQDTIFVRDMSDVITYWNRAAQELYGWTAEEAIGKHAHELLQTVFPVPVDQIRTELLHSGRWDGELKKTRADGTRIAVSSRWSLQREEQGRSAAILETNNDITERKRREEEIQRINQELARRSTELADANNELEAFAYSVSHDLRAPLRHMAG